MRLKTDFTLSNARRFYSLTGVVLGSLRSELVKQGNDSKHSVWLDKGGVDPLMPELATINK